MMKGKGAFEDAKKRLQLKQKKGWKAVNPASLLRLGVQGRLHVGVTRHQREVAGDGRPEAAARGRRGGGWGVGIWGYGGVRLRREQDCGGRKTRALAGRQARR
jgi:hypothetical protein